MPAEPDTPRKSKSPHRMNGRGGGWTNPTPDDGYLCTLRLATMCREQLDEPFPFEAAVMSYTLDARAGAVKAEADYIRIWGWTRKQFRLRWSEVVATAAEWASAFGRLTDEKRGQTGANEGPSQGQENADTDSDSTSRGQTGARQGPDRGQHTREQETRNEKKDPPNPPRGGKVTWEEEVEKIAIPPEFDSPAFREAWSEWIEYRRRATARPKIGWGKLFEGHMKKCVALWNDTRDPLYVLAAVRESTCQTWKGIYRDSSYKPATSKPTGANHAAPNKRVLPIDR